MAFDGIFVSALVAELSDKLIGGRIYKIYQPEVDEICLVVKNRTEEGNITHRLVISADAGIPLIYLTDKVKENPMVAPNFCMLLRKHIGNGRITDICQHGFDRIVEISLEHLDDMGDLCTKKLIVEIMGKHSNIIFIDSDGIIVDSIKHISHMVSSVREVLPGRGYVYPVNGDKVNPLDVDINYFMNHMMVKPEAVAKVLFTSMEGISPVAANEICYRAGVDGSSSTTSVHLAKKEELFREFERVRLDIEDKVYTNCIAYNGYEPKEFGSIALTSYGNIQEDVPKLGASGLKKLASPSEVIEEYYSKKTVVNRIKQRSIDLRKIVANAIDRTAKKYDLQLRQLKDTEKREKYKVYGELLMTYGYSAKPGDKELKCENYYTNEEITIPLDPDISPLDNSKKYFAKYNKLKRTYEALSSLTVESKLELDYLMSVQNSLEIADSLDDLTQIKAELIESGYIRGKRDNGKSKKQEKSKPLHYISSDGYHMYVGKNNFQNEELTFKVAAGDDMWFHAKNMPGSHVIVKTEGELELPDRTYEEAARLAAYYSAGKGSPKVEIDYTLRRNLKKPPKANPGFVIYHTNYSMNIEPDIHGIKEFNQ
ncbi:MAG: fibronectin/fibrinogen-binding protein [Lachnospiraceae bacterium]|nr:fibronectin/fibrinogen-binding protein [Lachnospiraceae bacterium]